LDLYPPPRLPARHIRDAPACGNSVRQPRRGIRRPFTLIRCQKRGPVESSHGAYSNRHARGYVPWPALQHAQSPSASSGTRTIVVAELDGIIHPIAAEYVGEAIAEAAVADAEVVVIVLRTPGGLLDSTRDIVSRMIASRAPVVVFVGPSGARAASAGFILTIAADVAVMAPGTHIGAARLSHS
jgi:hypothetical protein